MCYSRPLLRPVDLATAAASCTPAPRGPDDCKGFLSTYVGEVNHVPTCLVGPNPAQVASLVNSALSGDLQSVLASLGGTESVTWLGCVLAGGC
jgi:hypothetical protein